MKKFLSRILFFFLILLTANIPAYFIINKMLYQKYKQAEALKNYHNFIFADSHGFALKNYSNKYGIYNFSYNSDCYFDIYRKIKFLLKKNIKIDKIFLTVDDHTLSKYREVVNNANQSIYYADYKIFKESAIGNDLISFLMTKYVRYYFPLLQTDNSFLIKGYFVTVFKGEEKKLSDTANWKLATEKYEKTKQRIDGQFPNEKSSGVLKESLQKIMRLCKTNNIELVGIKFPLSKEFLSQLGEKSFHADSEFVKSNLPVLDYKYLYINEEEYFSNQDHLNDTGAKLFIKKFIADNNIKKQTEKLN